jgi:hypothetical protein
MTSTFDAVPPRRASRPGLRPMSEVDDVDWAALAKDLGRRDHARLDEVLDRA